MNRDARSRWSAKEGLFEEYGQAGGGQRVLVAMRNTLGVILKFITTSKVGKA